MNFHAVGRMLKIYFAVVALICAVLGYLVHSRMADNARLRSELMGDFGRLAKLARTDIGVPSSKSVREMSSRVTQLSDLYGSTLDSLSAKYSELPVLTPLEFKEELLRFSNEVKSLASEKGVTVDPSLGLAEYMGGKIPKNDEMSLLSQQLYIVKDMIAMLFNANIRKVNTIQFIAGKAKKDADKIYTSMALKLDISSGFYSIIDFIKALYVLPEIVWLNNLSFRHDLRFSDNNVLRASLDLEVVVQKEDFFASTKQK